VVEPLGDELMVQGGLGKDDLTIPDDIHPRDDLCAAHGDMEWFPDRARVLPTQ